MRLPKATLAEKQDAIGMLLESCENDPMALNDLVDQLAPIWDELTVFLVAFKSAEEAKEELNEAFELILPSVALHRALSRRALHSV